MPGPSTYHLHKAYAIWLCPSKTHTHTHSHISPSFPPPAAVHGHRLLPALRLPGPQDHRRGQDRVKRQTTGQRAVPALPDALPLAPALQGALEGVSGLAPTGSCHTHTWTIIREIHAAHGAAPRLTAGWPRFWPTNQHKPAATKHTAGICTVLCFDPRNPLRKLIVSLLLPTTNACRPLVSDASLSPARSPFILLLFRQPGVTQSATCHGMVWWWCGSIDQVVERLSGRQPTPLMNRLLHCECCIASCFKSAEASH